MLFGFLNGMDLQSFFISMLYRVPAILIALTVHECAHAYAAYKLGDPTAKNLGRLSLDPLKHMDLFGTLMLLFVGFGWARPVTINPRNFKKPRRDDTIVSLAGVTANLLTAFVMTGILALLINALQVSNEIIINIVLQVVIINLSLCFFNLIPIPPLDGYHVVKNAFIRVGANFFWNFERYGQILLIVVLLSGVLNGPLSFVINQLFKLFAGIFGLL